MKDWFDTAFTVFVCVALFAFFFYLLWVMLPAMFSYAFLFMRV